MIPTIIKTDLITPLARISSVTPITPVAPVPDALQSSPNFAQGQKFIALVEARLPNGNSSVLIAGQTLQMRLPENIVPGSKMELVLVAREPQFKFLLQNNAAPISTSPITKYPLQNDRPSDPDKNPQNISTMGRLLGSLAQDNTKSPLSQLSTNTAPILTSPPTNNIEIPVLLQKGLAQSGLFYESHQAQWITGKKTIEQLQQEPQGKLPVATAAISASINAESPVHAQALPLVQQQLTTLETGHLIWRGEIWPKQQMEWDISEHTAEDNAQEKNEPSSQWQTQLRLTLPKLGDVTATIIFNSQDVQIKLHTTAAKTAELLKNNQSPLTTAIVSAGMNIKTVEVRADAKE
ncbi:MAG: flagellar hook-length control protein FliK [Nitrosomonas sp.]|nr:flagellar hook-length control protein FliK [Nitrosomonas sp.]MDP1950564.1 flagellar hook-length control protein FliK [Nitrosomonas sp.]